MGDGNRVPYKSIINSMFDEDTPSVRTFGHECVKQLANILVGPKIVYVLHKHKTATNRSNGTTAFASSVYFFESEAALLSRC